MRVDADGPRIVTTLMVTGILSSLVLAACSIFDTDSNPGFGSPERAAEAFSPEDLPDVEPWNDENGACRVLLVGDSLVEAALRSHADAFTYVGCESIVDGVAARSLSEGWQCLADGGRSMAIVLRAFPEADNDTCRPSGLELVRQWADLTRLSSATVIALGTNDAGMYSEEEWIRRWNRVVELTGGPLIFVTVAGRPGDRWVDNANRYNATLRWWCSSEPRCVLAEWDTTAPARDVASYIDHVHLTRAVGEMRAVFIAVVVRRAAIPAPGGSRRWRAPEIIFPSAPSSTSSMPNSTMSFSPPATFVPPTNRPPSTAPATTLVSNPPTSPATTTSTTTTTTTLVPGETPLIEP